MIFHYPSLAPIEFFDRALNFRGSTVEAATDEIRDEFLHVLATEEGFTPYISYPQDVPQHQFAELNNSPRWSALHLWKMGQRVAGERRAVPADDACARGRAAARSARADAVGDVLAAQAQDADSAAQRRDQRTARDASAADRSRRLRLPRRQRHAAMGPGQAWVFDDTIEHEAWNDSDKLRVVLIFDVWHPHLTPPERALITALTAGVNEFTAGAPAPGESA